MAKVIAQSGTPTDVINSRIIVSVLLTDTTPSSGVTVTFSIYGYPIEAVGQSLSASTAVTGSDGIASVILTAGNVPGVYTVRASAATYAPATLDISVAVTLPTDRNIISLKDAKDYLGIPLTEVTNDTIISTWITEASSQIESIIGQIVVPRLVTDILSGDGSSAIITQSGRVLSIYETPDTMSNVQWRPSALDAWEDIATDSDEILIDATDPWVIRLIDLNFPKGYRNIRLCYNAGFSPIPGDFTEVCVEMVTDKWNKSKLSPTPRLGMSAQNKGGSGQSVGDSFVDLVPRWAARLAKYRRLV